MAMTAEELNIMKREARALWAMGGLKFVINKNTNQIAMVDSRTGDWFFMIPELEEYIRSDEFLRYTKAK